MSEIDGALAASRQAAEQLLGDAESLGSAWDTPRVPGKWSPSQTPMFGAVPVADFVRFMEQHMRHHWRQLPRHSASA